MWRFWDKNNTYKKNTYKVAGRTGGYMTLEATLIMPVVFGICIFIIYSGFLLYDKCVMKQDAYRAALRGSSIYRQDSQESYDVAEAMLKEIIQNKYIATACEYEVWVESKVFVTVKGQIQIPFAGLRRLTGEKGWRIEETVESKCLNPTLFIRMCKQLVSREKGKEK